MIFIEGALSILLAKEDIPQQRVWRSYVRHGGYCLAGMGRRFLPATQEPVGFGKFIMARRGIGLQFEAAAQSRFSLGLLFGFIDHRAQRQVGIRGFVIEASGSLQSFSRFRPIFLL